MFSDRIGPQIDSLEHAYFGLLPRVDNFSSASIVDGGDTTINFIIKRGSGVADTTIIAPKAALTELRLYVEHYEGLFKDDTTHIDWLLLNGIAQPQNPFVNNPIVVVVRSRSGEEIRGEVLYADARAIALGSSADQDYSRGRDKLRVRILVPSDILEMHDDRSFAAHFFNELNVPVGGNDTMYRDVIFPAIKDRMLYASTTPPELTTAMNDAVRAAHAGVSTTLAELEAQHPPNRFHAGIYYGLVIPGAAQYYPFESFYTGKKKSLILRPASKAYGVDVAYAITRRLGISLGFMTEGAKQLLPEDTSKDYERFSGSAIEALMQFLLIPAQRYLTSASRRLELAVGAGASMQLLAIDHRIKWSVADLELNATDHATTLGFALTLSAGYYLTPNLKLEIHGRQSIYPSQQVERHEIRSLGLGTFVLQSHDTYSFSPNTMDILFGIQYHF